MKSSQIKIRVILEPELQPEVETMNSWQRLKLARKFERWARQLRVSAFILNRDSSPKPRPSLKGLSKRKQMLN